MRTLLLFLVFSQLLSAQQEGRKLVVASASIFADMGLRAGATAGGLRGDEWSLFSPRDRGEESGDGVF